MKKNSSLSRPSSSHNKAHNPYQVTGTDLEVRRAQRLKSVALLKNERTPLQVIQLAEEAIRTAEEAVASAKASDPPNPPLACAEGCAWCCYLRVGTAVPEVIRIAEHIRREFTLAQIEATLARIHDTLEQRRAQRRNTGFPCPLLVDNLCSVYQVRPITCRGFNSSDPHACQRAATEKTRIDLPIYPPQLRLSTMVLDGLRAGITEVGFSGYSLELAAALEIALKEPNAVNQWLEGKPVFASARLT